MLRITLTILFRCEATPDNLDNPNANLRSHKKTEFLIRKFDSGIIWDNYGVRDDVKVTFNRFFIHANQTLLALYFPFSTSGYPQTFDTRPASSVNQRNVQGPSCYLG